MGGLECTEIAFSSVDLGDRIDAEYFSKEYISINNALTKVNTKMMGNLVTTVASAFYPAATQLYAVGDTAFVRCVDCINYPIITKEQDDNFEKIPYTFAEQNKGISFLNRGEIVITKVGTPCYASLVEDYTEVALSRTVLGLSKIHGVDEYYLLTFLRCKYGFEQLYRQRELTIQYQLTLPRVKAIQVFLPSDKFQTAIRRVCENYRNMNASAKKMYSAAETELLQSLCNVAQAKSANSTTTVFFSESFKKTGRFDAEYYQPKYHAYAEAVFSNPSGFAYIKDKFLPIKTRCGRTKEAYNYVEIGDISVADGKARANLVPTEDLPDNAKIMTKAGDLLVSTVRPNRGAVAILEADDLLVSGAFTVLRQSSDYPKEVLQVLLRSDLYKDWLLRYNVGTSYPVIKDDDVLNMPIPIIPAAVQTTVIEKVRESIFLHNKSGELFEAAKRAIELAVEQGEDIALTWLNSKVSTAEV